MFDKSKLIIEMNIQGKIITHFLSFSLSQKFNAHHEFELRIEHGKLGLPGLITLQDYREFIGSRIAISFGHTHATLQNFSGMITDVSLAQNHGFQGVVVIKGYSPTILMDRGKDVGSYLDYSLHDIVNTAKEGIYRQDLFVTTNPKRKQPIDYLIQYKESDFQFLNRLSAEYLEWFYYDGRQLHFGKPEELPQCKITYGREIRSLDYSLHLKPINHRRFTYLPQHDDLLTGECIGKSSAHSDVTFALDKSNEKYNKTYSLPLDTRIDNYAEIKEIVKNQEQANITQLLKVHAESDAPEVMIGGLVEIETSIRQDFNFVVDTLGKFLVTEITHHFDDQGRYSNRFTAIMGDSETIPVENYKKPNPEMQMADVVDNNDPEGLGRVKVKFKWNTVHNDVSEWLRVLTPNAGTGERGQNRGYFSIPEIGDHVMVGFEEGNIARPVVMGSLYNKSTVNSSSLVENHLKSITTRTGHLIEFDDSEDSQGIKITDIKGNSMHIDTVGNNITITALENMTLNCKNMQINVGENMDVQVGQDQSVNIGNNQSTMVNKDIATTAGNNFSLSASGNITESSDNRTELASKDFMRTSEVSNEIASEMTIFSQKENMTLQSGKSIEVNSSEKSKIF